MKQLEDPLRSVEIAQRMLTEVAQAGSCRQGIASQVLRRQGEEHLATVGGGQQAGEAIESGSEVVPVCGARRRRYAAPCGRASAPTHLGPRLRYQRPLGIEGRGHGIRGGGEGGLDGIANAS